jgi:hypothetical protein
MKRRLSLALFAVLTLMAIVSFGSQQAMAQNPSGIWHVNANGYIGDLNVTSYNAANGRISGTVFGNPMQGFWDDNSKRITFTRTINIFFVNTIQVYTGYLFTGPENQSAMAGSFEAFAGTGATVERPVYGWVASRYQAISVH